MRTTRASIVQFDVLNLMKRFAFAKRNQSKINTNQIKNYMWINKWENEGNNVENMHNETNQTNQTNQILFI